MISAESGYVWLLTDHVYRHAVEELSEERNRNESCSYDDLIEALDGTVSFRFSFYPEDEEYLKQRLLTGKVRVALYHDFYLFIYLFYRREKT